MQVVSRIQRLKNIIVEDEECCELLSTCRRGEDVERIWELIHQDRHLTIHDLCKEINLPYRSHQCILSDLNMRRISAKFVSYMLMVKQKENRLHIYLISQW